ncbi:hypothetical protein [Xanthomonas sp. SI]|uniref:hypothetical protein n=1 Tax=Xanthomonas sp. SI TaxID=2724123 RepID=UPI001C8CFC7B|nr:hypothetical protein [Xanthomonas sp. SI]
MRKLIEGAAKAAAESRGKDAIRENYERVVLVSLGRFQLLEFALKRHIGKLANLQKNFRKKDQLLKELDELSLGLLLKRLKIADNGEPLIDQIRPLLEVRNEIAHQSLLWISGIDNIDIFHHFNATIAYSAHAMAVQDCLRELAAKLNEPQVGI